MDEKLKVWVLFRRVQMIEPEDGQDRECYQLRGIFASEERAREVLERQPDKGSHFVEWMVVQGGSTMMSRPLSLQEIDERYPGALDAWLAVDAEQVSALRRTRFTEVRIGLPICLRAEDAVPSDPYYWDGRRWTQDHPDSWEW